MITVLSPQSISITSGSTTLALLSPDSLSFLEAFFLAACSFFSCWPFFQTEILLSNQSDNKPGNNIVIFTCETVLQRSDKFIKFHLVHCRDDVLAVDGLPALVLRHRVGLRRRVENKYTGAWHRDTLYWKPSNTNPPPTHYHNTQ